MSKLINIDRFAGGVCLRICIFNRCFYVNNYRPYFSERNGYRKVKRLFGWAYGMIKVSEDKQDD